MEQFLRQLQTIPEAAELIRRVEEGGCPGGGQRPPAGAAGLRGRGGGGSLRPAGGVPLRGRAGGPGPLR